MTKGWRRTRLTPSIYQGAPILNPRTSQGTLPRGWVRAPPSRRPCPAPRATLPKQPQRKDFCLEAPRASQGAPASNGWERSRCCGAPAGETPESPHPTDRPRPHETRPPIPEAVRHSVPDRSDLGIRSPDVSGWRWHSAVEVLFRRSRKPRRARWPPPPTSRRPTEKSVPHPIDVPPASETTHERSEYSGNCRRKSSKAAVRSASTGTRLATAHLPGAMANGAIP